jgi:hypothetical protein
VPKKSKTPSSHLAFWKTAANRNPFQMSLDWSDEAIWISAARTALNIHSGFSEKWNRPVRKAFEDFRLDPNNPHDWRLLLTLYVHSHRSRGRPAEWNDDSLCNLLRHISAVREKRPDANSSDIYRILTKPKATYAGKTANYLKHGHRLALNLERNGTLRNARDLIVAEKRVKEPKIDEALALIGAPFGGLGKK